MKKPYVLFLSEVLASEKHQEVRDAVKKMMDDFVAANEPVEEKIYDFGMMLNFMSEEIKKLPMGKRQRDLLHWRMMAGGANDLIGQISDIDMDK